MINTVDKNGDGKISFSEFRLELWVYCKSISTKKLTPLQGYDGRVSTTRAWSSRQKEVTIKLYGTS